MSEMNQLTVEQKKLLESLEEEFKDRYTEEDEDYRRVLDNDQLIPPIVERWYGDRNNDRSGRNDRYRNYRNDRRNDRNDRHDRRRDYYNNDERRYNPYQRGYRDSYYETNNYPNYRHRPY